MLGSLSGCGTLNPGGVYAGDNALYQADLTIATSYDVLHSFVLFEYENRAGLANAPEIQLFANKVRAGAPQWFATALALRDAYASNPAGATKTALQQAVDVLRTATLESTRYLSQSGRLSGSAPAGGSAAGQVTAPAAGK
jgi:hypothetical protein